MRLNHKLTETQQTAQRDGWPHCLLIAVVFDYIFFACLDLVVYYCRYQTIM